MKNLSYKIDCHLFISVYVHSSNCDWGAKQCTQYHMLQILICFNQPKPYSCTINIKKNQQQQQRTEQSWMEQGNWRKKESKQGKKPNEFNQIKYMSKKMVHII